VSCSRARVSILSELLAFPTINQKDWDTGRLKRAQVGDLVSISSGPPTKWYLSWVKKIEEGEDRFSHKYLLESIDDGELCWWSNVGLNIYSRDRVKGCVIWQWDDKQFAFNDRWNKACKKNGAYIVLPVLPVFGKEWSVVLNVRIRHRISDFRNPKTFPDWRKLTIKQMGEFYKECYAKYNGRAND